MIFIYIVMYVLLPVYQLVIIFINYFYENTWTDNINNVFEVPEEEQHWLVARFNIRLWLSVFPTFALVT